MITCLNNLNDRLNLLINTAKQNYYSKNVENTQRSSKAYWSLFKIFLNNNFLNFLIPTFADQCSLIRNSSELPREPEYSTQSSLSSITFSKDDTAKMIQNLDPNKAHGHDQISNRMLKICSTSICKPLKIIFHRCLGTGTFPNGWKNMLLLFTKKVINKFSKTTVRSRYFLCVAKYLRN